MKEEPIKRGSTKDIYRREPGTLDFENTGRWSAFDVGPHHQGIPGKAKALTACAVHTFRIAKALGINTHFVEQVDEVTIRVKEVEILDPSKGEIPFGTNSYALPLEFIGRHLVAGSILRGFNDGSKNPFKYGFPEGYMPNEGDALPRTVFQTTTKLEKVDRELELEDALRMAGISKNDLQQIYTMIARLDGGIGMVATQAGFRHVDGKKEFGIDENGHPMLIDFAGTPDEDRFWNALGLRSGQIINVSKERLRQLLIKNGYYDKLKAARAASEPDPPYPDLTDKEIAGISDMYTQFAERYTSVKITDYSAP